jgi:hypothetical protein
MDYPVLSGLEPIINVKLCAGFMAAQDQAPRSECGKCFGTGEYHWNGHRIEGEPCIACRPGALA